MNVFILAILITSAVRNPSSIDLKFALDGGLSALSIATSVAYIVLTNRAQAQLLLDEEP
jgi:hypothetical protein